MTGLALDRLTAEDFAGCLNGPFALRLDGSCLDLRLVRVQKLGQVAEERRDPFSLLFRGSLAPVLPQCIYRLEHPRLGPLDIFLVPVGPDHTGMRYEAIFT